MHIAEQTLHIEGRQIALPAMAQDALVRAWRVPVEYRPNGIFLAVFARGAPEEVPACNSALVEYIGECDYPASYAAKLGAAKIAKLAEINAACDAAVFALTATYPQAEIQSWPQQVKEAEAYPNAPTPLLESIALQRGLGVDELVQRVRAKVQAFSVGSGHYIGQRQALEDAIDAAQSLEELEAIQWQSVSRSMLPA